MAAEVSPPAAVAEGAVYVAVSRKVSDTKAVLKWALENRGDCSICILHVHRPDKLIQTALGKFPAEALLQHHVEAHRVIERKKLSEKLDEHLHFCRHHGVQAAKVYIEMDSIQEGIVKLLNGKKIQKLVMGAAAQKRYSRRMIEILSEKAKYVRENAPDHTHIWFVCNNRLINTREAMAHPDLVRTITMNEQDVVNKDGVRISEPSTPDLTIPWFANNYQKEVDTWLHPQKGQMLYHSMNTSPSRSSTTTVSSDGSKNSFNAKTRETESPWWDELENVKSQRDKLFEELQAALDHKLSLETKLEEFDLKLKDLQQRLELADEMKMERDNAVKRVEELKKQLKEGDSSPHLLLFCSEIPFSEIKKATNDFDHSLKVGEDDYGHIYKGFLHLTQVNVKIPRQYGSSVPREFHQEVELLCKLRHPNIVNLIGICLQSHAIIYEHCARGRLEDQLNNKDHASPLKWHNRLKIAADLCTVLAFLHSFKPYPIYHGDIRPETIYLDSHYTAKLVNFNVSNLITRGEFALEKMASNFAYMDPTCLATGEPTKKSDVYSFGVMLLMLLVGKPALGIAKRVQNAMNGDGIGGLLDPWAGWPLETADELASLALRCCDMIPERRPDFEPDVWRVLEAMKIGEIV